tara:strand:- start:462 stop:698 length:237 start_codon:yes stop_codon:yes gene_type:complete
MGFKETYVQYSDARVKEELEEIRQLLCDVMDGTADMKEVSDTLVNLEVIQEHYTTMSDTVKAYDQMQAKFDDMNNILL